MPRSKNRRKKDRKSKTQDGPVPGGSMLALRSAMKKAVGTGSNRTRIATSAAGRRSNLISTIITVVLLIAAAVVLYWRFVR